MVLSNYGNFLRIVSTQCMNGVKELTSRAAIKGPHLFNAMEKEACDEQHDKRSELLRRVKSIHIHYINLLGPLFLCSLLLDFFFLFLLKICKKD